MSQINSMSGWILLRGGKIDWDVFRLQFFDDWKVEIEGDADDTQLCFVINQVSVACTYHEGTLQAAAENATKNYSWMGAAEEIAGHTAYVQLDVAECEHHLQRHILFTMIASSMMKQRCALGLYQYPVTRKAEDYIEDAERLNRDDMPVLSWVYIGLYQDKNGLWNAYTYGLEEFGREEIEILHTEKGLVELYQFLANLVAYLVTFGETLESGRPVGSDDSHVYPVTRSEGSVLDGETWKIEF